MQLELASVWLNVATVVALIGVVFKGAHWAGRVTTLLEEHNRRIQHIEQFHGD